MSRKSFALALTLFAGSVARVDAAPAAFLQDQTALAPNINGSITSFVLATDFSLTVRTRLESAEIWLCDSTLNDNGVVDSYSGTLSWRIHANAAGMPGAAIAAGSVSLAAADAGFNCSIGVNAPDAGRVRIAFDSRATLDPGTYWLAVREGSWSQADDGSDVYWMGATGSSGSLAQFSGIAGPDNWSSLGVEVSLHLLGVAPQWAQLPGDLSGSSAVGISDAAIAVDFPVPSSFPEQGGFEVYLADSTANDNGLFDSFNGTISWGVYTDFLGAPDSLLASGSDAAPVVRDTLYQDIDGGDVFAVRSELRDLPSLAPGTYWLVIHEGAWLQGFDGSHVWWLESPGVVGNPHLSNPDETDADPGTWIEGSNWDPAFAIFDEVLFVSGFEPHTACAWSSATGGALCP